MCVVLAVAILEDCYMASADIQRLFYSVERIVVHRPFVYVLLLYFSDQFYRRDCALC